MKQYQMGHYAHIVYICVVYYLKQLLCMLVVLYLIIFDVRIREQVKSNINTLYPLLVFQHTVP